MKDYHVVRFDDGVQSCVKASKVRSKNGQYSARWKNTWYNVVIIMNGDRNECENFIKDINTEQKIKYVGKAFKAFPEPLLNVNDGIEADDNQVESAHIRETMESHKQEEFVSVKENYVDTSIIPEGKYLNTMVLFFVIFENKLYSYM